MKPDRKIYDLALRALGCPGRPMRILSEMVAFDELRGAAAAGMTAIQAAWYLRQEVAWAWDHPLPRAESIESLPSMLN